MTAKANLGGSPGSGGPGEVAYLRHAKVELALHTLRVGVGRPLLVLHGLGQHSPASMPAELEGWPGPAFALDFTGHGLSTIPEGGGYTAEILMGDADAALAALGEATILGRGLGGYVGLMLAGSRPGAVRGAIICDGPGLAGGGPRAGSSYIPLVTPDSDGPPDPFALAELSRDIRPPDYASSFARQATHLSDLPEPVAVSAKVRPEWLEAVLAEPGICETSLDEALRLFS